MSLKVTSKFRYLYLTGRTDRIKGQESNRGPAIVPRN